MQSTQEDEGPYEIHVYIRQDGTAPFRHWLEALRDERARIAVDRRIERVSRGNFGDHKFERDGVWELRIDFGPGYRVYYGLAGRQVVLLLCGGDKGTQSRDLNRACDCWEEWKRQE